MQGALQCGHTCERMVLESWNGVPREGSVILKTSVAPCSCAKTRGKGGVGLTEATELGSRLNGAAHFFVGNVGDEFEMSTRGRLVTTLKGEVRKPQRSTLVRP